MDRDILMTKAKIGLLDPDSAKKGGSPVFYSSILFSLRLEWTDKLPTAAVDGRCFFVNEAFFRSLDLVVQIAMLAHEVLHIALRHIDGFQLHNRKVYAEKVEHMLWNMAGDYFINLALHNANYTIGSNWLMDKRFKGKTTYQIYCILHDEYTASGCSMPLMQDGDIIFPVEDGTVVAKNASEKLRKEITATIAKAQLTAEMSKEYMGNLPGDIIRNLKAYTHPRLPFEVILANYMSNYAKDDFSWNRPCRRFLPDYYMPSAYSERLCNLVCAFDISGSVTNKQVSSFREGIRVLNEELKPEKITLIQWDTQIQKIEKMDENSDVRKIQFHGGGGTIIQPLVDWISDNRPEVTLVFTDGAFKAPSYTKVSTDIIFLIEGNLQWKTTYGRVFHYSL